MPDADKIKSLLNKSIQIQKALSLKPIVYESATIEVETVRGKEGRA